MALKNDYSYQMKCIIVEMLLNEDKYKCGKATINKSIGTNGYYINYPTYQ